MISGKTKLFGVIGFPIEHSLSPVIHNKAFEILKLDYVYIPMKVEPAALAQALAGLRAMNFTGINVTIPHKQAVMPFLDKIDDEAKLIGAVNTIKNINGKLHGYTTDASGYIRSVEQKGISLKKKSVLILGGGGAARSLAMGLAMRALPASITVLGRTAAKAKKIVRDAAKFSSLPVQAGELTPRELKNAIGENDILINCTSVGMHPDTGRTPVPREFFRKGLIVSDIVYNPLKTRLLREAKKAGCITVDGLGMLIHQGIAAFEIWTGKRPPVEPLRKEALKWLKKR